MFIERNGFLEKIGNQRNQNQIHCFENQGYQWVLDIASGAVHVFDKLAFKLVQEYTVKTKSELVESYLDSYSKEELEEAIREIEALIADDRLFSQEAVIDRKRLTHQNSPIKAMCLHVTHDCNLRCKYCFADGGDYSMPKALMTAEVGKKALKFLVDHSQNRHNLEVDFFGGEPLMNFEVVKELVTYGRELEKEYDKNFRFTITTNGVLLTDEIDEYMKKEMSNVVLSLDGRPEVNDRMRRTLNDQGSFDVIAPKFQHSVAARGDRDYYVRGTFTAHNLDFSKDVEFYHEMGFVHTSMEPVVSDPKFDYALREEHLPQIMLEYDRLAAKYVEWRKAGKKFSFFHFHVDLDRGPCIIKKMIGCGAGSEYVAVSPEGDLFPCHQFVGEDDFKMGTVDTGIVNPEIPARFSDLNIFTKEACRNCWARYFCGGGCHAHAYYANNDLKKPFAVACEMERKRVECAIGIQAALAMGEESNE